MRRALLFVFIGMLMLYAAALMAADPQPPLSMHQRMLKGVDVDKAEDLQRRIDNAAKQDNYAEAIKLAEELLALRTKAQGADHWETVNQSWLLKRQRKIATLLPQQRKEWRQALQGVNEAPPLEVMGKFEDAFNRRKAFLNVCQAIFGEEHTDTANAFSDLAYNLKVQGKHAAAQPLDEKSLELFRKLVGEKHLDTATCYNNLAASLHGQRKYAAAQPMYQEAVKLFRELFGDGHPMTAASFLELAKNLQLQDKRAEAQPLFQEVLEIRLARLGEEHPDTAASLDAAGENLLALGNTAQAQPLLRRALEVRIKLLGEKHVDTAVSYNNLSIVLDDLGKYVEGYEMCRRALDIHRRLYGEKHILIAIGYNNLAENLRYQHKHKEALPLLRKALDIVLSRLGEKSPLAATTHNNLGTNLLGQHEYRAAEEHFQKALDIRRELFGDRHAATILSYENLSAILMLQGKHASARPLLQKAADLSGELLGPRHPFSISCLNNLSASHLAQGEYEASRDVLLKAATAYEGARLTASDRGLDRVEFGTKKSPYPTLAAVQAQMSQATPAWEAAEADLARGLADEAAGSSAALFTAAEREEHIRLSTQLRGLQRGILEIVARRDPTEREQEELRSLDKERRTIEDRLAELGAALSRRELASLADVQAAIPSAGALVCWVDVTLVGAEEHWGCVVRREGEPHWERLPGTGAQQQWTDDDQDLPSQLRTDLASGVSSASECERKAHSVFTQRLAPLSRHLEGVKALYVVGVNEMAGVPVETLGRDYTVSYVPSGTFLARLAKKPARTEGGLLGTGDPIFTQDRSSKPTALAGLRGGNWKELPGTHVELTQIGKLFGSAATLLLNSAASEQSLEALRERGDLARYRYLHFATHGEPNDVRTFESALILAQDALPKDPYPPAGKPLINGQLSAQEVRDYWKLDAELVTLSACETALGRRGGGDGLLGFSQAFLSAGARSVCLSLWKVDDTATCLLMQRFYQNLLGKRPGLDKPLAKAEALAEAKKWLRELSAEEALKLTSTITDGIARRNRGKDEDLNLVVPGLDPKEPAAKDSKPFAHPRYWAAFILIGDPN